MKRKNKPIRRPDAVQPLPLPADADEIAFAHATAAAKILYRSADLAVFRRRRAGGGHRILPVLRLVMVRISCDPEGYASSGSFSAEKPVVNA